MRKKTNKLAYVLLGLGTLASIALIPFSIKRKNDFLTEGNPELADFSVKMGVFGAVCAVVLLGGVCLLLWRDRRIAQEQKMFAQELGRTPQFDRWLRNEEEQLQRKHSGQRKLLAALSVPMIILLIVSAVMMLDTVSGMSLFGAASILFGFFAVWFVWYFSDYGKQYMRSLLKSVSEELPTAMEKEAFAGQIINGAACSFAYHAGPQSGNSTAWVTQEYTYFRQFRKCRIIHNRNLEHAVLKKEWFTPGMRPHFRICYVLEVSMSDGKRAWRGYFSGQEALFLALDILKRGGLAQEKVENRIS